jgi:PAS domain S-box-containing protein
MLRSQRLPLILLAAAVLILLYLTSLRNYLLFHSLAEVFSIVIAFSIFIIAWNARRWMENGCLLFLGIAYLFVGAFDLIHTLAYTGMGVFPGSTSDLPTQIWIAARYLESLSLLIAPVFMVRRLRPPLVLAAYTAAAAVLLASIFYWRNFPTCFAEGSGLTTFKKTSEYVICGILVGSIISFTRWRDRFDPGILRLLVASICLTIASELAFTFYVSVYGFSNLVGHYFKIVSFYLIYKALIETGLRQPYDLLFREIKQREDALSKSERKFRALAENAPNIIVSIDCGLGILYANPAIRAFTGRQPRELIGMTPAQAGLPPRLCDFLAGHGRRICESASVETIELELSAAEGNRCFSVTFVPETSADAEDRRILLVATDITALREAEKITRRDKQALEKLVARRSEELLQVQRKLDEAKHLSSIGTLAATVAHELRNPLGVIKTAVYNIRRKSKEKAIERNLANVEKKIAESNLIISNLLRYSRIRPPSHERANLFEIINEALEAAAGRFSDHTVTVVADLDALRSTEMELDVVQIKEVFDNLINNAYQAVPPNQGRIEVVGGFEPSRGVSISIRDNGCGMAPEVLEKIFEPFFTTRSSGTGLGLAICKEIVNLHGGAILIESEPGSGTTATVTIPHIKPER